jgi:hypothetical protein
MYPPSVNGSAAFKRTKDKLLCGFENGVPSIEARRNHPNAAFINNRIAAVDQPVAAQLDPGAHAIAAVTRTSRLSSLPC